MNKKILIIDDDIAVLDILTDFLDIYEVFDITNGHDAYEVLNTQQIDLILLDVMMIEMDGFEICSLLKEDNKLKNIPVIFITGKNDEQSIKKAYEVGGVDYITKPIKKLELLSRVKTHLSLCEQRQLLENFISKQKNMINKETKIDIIKQTIQEIKEEISIPLEQLMTKSNKQMILNTIDKVSNNLFTENNFITINKTYKYDINSNSLYYRKKPLDLSLKESLLLQLFMDHIGEPVTIEQIAQAVWDEDNYHEVSKESVKSQVSKLRKKFSFNIQNVYGVGYIFKA